jgi:rhodanese-related sulfurtransferase
MLTSLWVVLAAVLMSYMKAKSGKTLSTQEATMLVNRSKGVILDIRERNDFEKGHIADAVNIPLAKINDRMVELEKNKENPIIVVCQMGHQSGDAVKALEAGGFPQVSRMSGGIAEWKAQNLPLVK